MTRHLAACIAIALVTAVAAGSPSVAQSYPSGPVQVIVPYAPGGQGDITARVVSEPLSESLGQPVIVENRPGANGTIGTTYVAGAQPDGRTLAVVVGSHVMTKALMPTLSYDPIEDFVPISLMARTDIVLVVPASLPVDTLADFVDYVAERPDELVFASAGVGSNAHVFAEWLLRETGLEMIHVPYQGSGASHPDLMNGTASMAFDTLPSVRGLVEQGRLKLLAFAGMERSPDFPDVPTIAESGYPEFDASSWSVLLAPAGTPDDVVQQLNGDVVEILRRSDVQERLAGVGARVVASSPEETMIILREETDRYTTIINEVGIVME